MLVTKARLLRINRCTVQITIISGQRPDLLTSLKSSRAIFGSIDPDFRRPLIKIIYFKVKNYRSMFIKYFTIKKTRLTLKTPNCTMSHVVHNDKNSTPSDYTTPQL